MLRRIIVLLFIAIATPAISQSGVYEKEDLQFITDFHEGVVLVPIDRIEGGIKQNSLESSQKEESNLAIFNALNSSSISEYYFFYKENVEVIKRKEFAGNLLDKSLDEVTVHAIENKALFIITFLEPGHVSFPEVRTFKKTKSGLKCDIRNLESGAYKRRESEAHLRNMRLAYQSVRWSSEEVANAKLLELHARETEEYQQILAKKNDPNYVDYHFNVDGEMFNRDFGRFPVMELRRLEPKHVEVNSKKYIYFHSKYEARIYPELSQWESMSRAVAEIERQIAERLLKYDKGGKAQKKDQK